MIMTNAKTKPDFVANGITASGVYFRPHGVEILPPMDIEFRAGELTALLGPNGAGKSTLLKLISGDIKSNGVVHYGTDCMTDLNIKELAKRRAVLPQESFLSFAFSTREVVALGDLDEDSEDLIDQCIAEVGLTDLSERSYLTLSGGQKQRCQMARVLVQIYSSMRQGYAPVVFLDEPTSAMDMSHQHHILGIGRRLADKGLCVVVVLHDLTLASQYAQRVVVLRDGTVYTDGAVEQVMTPDMVQDVYKHTVDVVKHKGQVIVIPHTV